MNNLKIFNQTIKLTIACLFLLITFVFIEIPENASATLVKNSSSEAADKIKTVILTGSFHFSKETNYRDSVFYKSSDTNSNSDSDSVIQFSDFDSILKSLEAIINFTTGKDKKEITEDSNKGGKKDPNKSNKKDSKNNNKKDSDKRNKQDSNKSSKSNSKNSNKKVSDNSNKNDSNKSSKSNSKNSNKNDSKNSSKKDPKKNGKKSRS